MHGRVQRQNRGRDRRGQGQRHISDEIRATIVDHVVTVFLSLFGAFLRTEIKFSKLLVQPPHHLVTCAHHKSSFSFF